MNKTIHRIYILSFLLIGVIVTILLAIYGYEYYTTPLEERFIDVKHHVLKPSGVLGHGFGIVGTLMMIAGVSIYMLRKRVRILFNLGYLKHWLELHIFLCTVGPVLVLYHTAFKFGGIVSISFWSMVLVVLSGVVGRFIYVQIPRTIQGHEMSINAANELRENLASKVKSTIDFDQKTLFKFNKLTSLDRYKEVTFITSLSYILIDPFKRWRILSRVKSILKSAKLSKDERIYILNSAKSEIILTRKIGLLRTFHRLFHYWHIAHLPFALIMFIIMLVHVGVTIAFGYKWIF